MYFTLTTDVHTMAAKREVFFLTLIFSHFTALSLSLSLTSPDFTMCSTYTINIPNLAFVAMLYHIQNAITYTAENHAEVQT